MPVLRYTHRHTHTHFTKPPKATCGSLPGLAKLMTSRCCHWWASQHVVVYLRSAPTTHRCDPNSPLPPVKHALGSGCFHLGGYLCYRGVITWLGELYWGFDGQAHHTGSWKDSEWKCVRRDKTRTCLCIRPRGYPMMVMQTEATWPLALANILCNFSTAQGDLRSSLIRGVCAINVGLKI